MTIVVLLILAGITIVYVFGENSIFKKASDAKDKTEEAKKNEQDYFSNIDNTINQYVDGKGGTTNSPAKEPQQMEQTAVYAKLYDDGTMIFSSFDYTSTEHRNIVESYGESELYFDPEAGPPEWINVIGDVPKPKARKVIIYDKIAPLKTAYWFYGVMEISGLENLITNNVTSMELMFAESQVESLDVNHFDTSNVTNMRAMFSECHQLTSLNLSNFDTSKVTDMRQMFAAGYLYGPRGNLVELDISGFTFKTDVKLQNIFQYNEKLERIYIKTQEDAIRLKTYCPKEDVQWIIK